MPLAPPSVPTPCRHPSDDATADLALTAHSWPKEMAETLDRCGEQADVIILAA